MTAPVKNNEVPQNDPYADPYADGESYGDPYGDEVYGDEEFGMGEDAFFDETGEGGEGAPLTVDYARQQLNDLLEMLKISDLSPTEKKEIKAEIAALKGKINVAVSMSDSAQEMALGKIQETMFELENRIMGTGEEGEGGSLKSQLEDTKEKILADTNLSEKKRKEMTDKIDKWLSTLELGASEEMESKIMDEFMALQEEYANAALFSSGASTLAELTGMDPSEIEALAQKHGVDLNNLPNPPDAKLAALIAELPNIGGLVDDVKSKYTDLQNQIDSAVSSANATNEANQASDSSKKDSTDWTPFQFLYNAKFHRDDASQALANAKTALAKEVANVLSALYGTEVTAIEDPAKCGMVSFNGMELNVLGTGGANATIGFSESPPEWPSVDLVQVYVDDEGDGKTDVPPWMRDAHYPYHIYDTGGAAYSSSGNWAWQEVGGEQNGNGAVDLIDVGHAV